ncbi:hypothetical protein HDV00_010108 [Rhizophlyctis rosea]|nr:hypothetical protein HDV00_010108 [Rhizophlyctis rosea]
MKILSILTVALAGLVTLSSAVPNPDPNPEPGVTYQKVVVKKVAAHPSTTKKVVYVKKPASSAKKVVVYKKPSSSSTKKVVKSSGGSTSYGYGQTGTTSFKQTALNLHNQVRSSLKRGVPNLTWSAEQEARACECARKWANRDGVSDCAAGQNSWKSSAQKSDVDAIKGAISSYKMQQKCECIRELLVRSRF